MSLRRNWRQNRSVAKRHWFVNWTRRLVRNYTNRNELEVKNRGPTENTATGQVICLPEEFRLHGSQVRVRRESRGRSGADRPGYLATGSSQPFTFPILHFRDLSRAIAKRAWEIDSGRRAASSLHHQHLSLAISGIAQAGLNVVT